ncbi:PP2C family protein-serine/threonine phosphatase [Bradyrhizobium sp. AZCC 1721]|uniref:PP2C family protein-serine/threonine phosphatase n=1 Tax=Bradyrhizobium sp. AZCC 1721 TaxID=3117016 RepID=UPI002FF2A795
MLDWTIAAFTHRGRVRPDNEDAIAIGTRILAGDMDAPLVMTAPNDSCLLMIADGMGGHAHGAIASRAALDYLVAAADRLAIPRCCGDVIEAANQNLFALMQEDEATLGMGTTVVGAVLSPTRLLTFNVGDSRCYLFSAGELVQLSKDDVPKAKDKQPGPRTSHAITQALGGSWLRVATRPHITVDAPLESGETLLLCSDGLTDMVGDHVIANILRAIHDPLRSTRELAAKAFSAGAVDNISVVLARRSDIPGAIPGPLRNV